MALKKAGTEEKTFEVKVTRAKEFKSGDVGFDMVVNGVTIYGCVYKESKRGNFVSFPSRKNESDGKYYSYAYFKIDDKTLELIESQISDLL